MTDEAIASAKADIESTTDLLERALKLSGLITSLFAERGFKLVVVGGSAVEFYTEGGYMSGDIDFCRKTLNAIPPRVMQEIVAKLGGKGVARSWLVCGLYVDMLGVLETESTKPNRELETPYGTISIIPPELALVERVLFAYCPPTAECVPDSRNEVIRLSWEEWQAGRAAKRETLRKLGLDAPSRRPFGHDDRLRAAFGGSRAPSFAS